MNYRPIVKAVAVVLLLTRPAPMEAQIAVTDAGQIAKTALVLIQAANTASHTLDQLRQMQVALKNLDPTSAREILRLANQSGVRFRSITRDVNTISYKLGLVDRDYKRVYGPTSRMTPEERNAAHRRWENELKEQSQVAMRASARMETLQKNSEQSAEIVNRSQSTRGIVGQLNNIVQMLAVLHSQLESIGTSIHAMNRTSATEASNEASRAQLRAEQKTRNMANYTSRGAPVAVRQTLP